MSRSPIMCVDCTTIDADGRTTIHPLFQTSEAYWKHRFDRHGGETPPAGEGSVTPAAAPDGLLTDPGWEPSAEQLAEFEEFQRWKQLKLKSEAV